MTILSDKNTFNPLKDNISTWRAFIAGLTASLAKMLCNIYIRKGTYAGKNAYNFKCYANFVTKQLM